MEIINFKKNPNLLAEDDKQPKKKSKRNNLKKSVLFVILGFIAVILIGAILLSLPISSKSREMTNFIDCFFVSTSSVCITGLTPFSNGNHFSYFGQAVILFLIQFGGLGFMTITSIIIILAKKRVSLANRIQLQDSLSYDSPKDYRKLIKRIILLTFVIEFIGFIILLAPMIIKNGAIGVWQAFFTSISAFCNAGVDVFIHSSLSNSLSMFKSSPLVLITISVLVILGGLGFSAIMDSAKSKFNIKKMTLHTKVVLITSLSLILLGWISFLALEFSNPQTIGSLSVSDKFLNTYFLSVSSRTAGFTTYDIGQMSNPSRLIFNLLMFIGASPGSTGGGIKTTTFVIVVVYIVNALRGQQNLTLNKKTIRPITAQKAMALLVLFLGLSTIASILIMIIEKNNIYFLSHDQSFAFEVIVRTVFSSFSTTGVSGEYMAYYSRATEMILCVMMFLGRIGLLPMSYIFITKVNDNIVIKYPECNIMVG